MKELRPCLYAEYYIDGIKRQQIIESGNVEDIIYEDGMTDFIVRLIVKDGDNYVELPLTESEYAVGKVYTSRELLDLQSLKLDAETIDLFKMAPNTKWYITRDGNIRYVGIKKVIGAKDGNIVETELPENTLNGREYWYVELHNGSDITYEKTKYNDKKYRGQKCDYYYFVKVVEYELNGKTEKIIIKREEKREYTPYTETPIDIMIDSAKALMSREKFFSGFAGASPLYSFNTEDISCVFHDKKDQIKNQNVVTVTGSGDAILDLFLNGANKIISFDINGLTPYYAELKFIAAKYLSFDDFKKLLSSFDKDVYDKIVNFLSPNTRLFWDSLYEYSSINNISIKNCDDSGLFYSAGLFSANETIGNENSYYSLESFNKLQSILKTKSLDDIQFITCDIYELPDKVDLSDYSYAYLSNIMDFLVGIQENVLSVEKLNVFKSYIVDKLIPSMKKNCTIDLSYLNTNWHMFIEDEPYYEKFPLKEGFSISRLSNGKDRVLSFSSDLLYMNAINYNSMK